LIISPLISENTCGIFIKGYETKSSGLKKFEIASGIIILTSIPLANNKEKAGAIS